MVIRVQTRDNEPIEKALRRLRKLCNNEGLTRTSKAKAYFEKPSERRRREERERRKAIRLAMRARRQDVAKLLNRRRKARKNARAAQRADNGDEGSGQERGPGRGGEHRPRSGGRGPERGSERPAREAQGEPRRDAERPADAPQPASTND